VCSSDNFSAVFSAYIVTFKLFFLKHDVQCKICANLAEIRNIFMKCCNGTGRSSKVGTGLKQTQFSTLAHIGTVLQFGHEANNYYK
jgi:hypothetical protein